MLQLLLTIVYFTVIKYMLPNFSFCSWLNVTYKLHKLKIFTYDGGISAKKITSIGFTIMFCFKKVCNLLLNIQVSAWYYTQRRVDLNIKYIIKEDWFKWQCEIKPLLIYNNKLLIKKKKKNFLRLINQILYPKWCPVISGIRTTLNFYVIGVILKYLQFVIVTK